ncbi:MAG: hypothetical protein H6765_05025 [Candidatus Peribacteria bacterium]|nr:MAG: hypothetical protein H6765_05025 [Candidatus Peribacteria bacterium]
METPNEESPPKSLVIMEKMKHLFEKKLGDALEPIYVGGNHQIHVDDTGMVAVSASKIQLAAFQDALSYAQQKPGPIVLRIDHIGGKETLERFLQAGISPNRESKIYKLAEMCVELQSIFATEAEYNDIP